MEYCAQWEEAISQRGLKMHPPQAKVLVVDDEPSIRSIFSQIIADLGYVVRSAADGFSALAEMRKELPDVVVSDLNMPGMSGFELLSVIRRRFPKVQVIAMSGAFSGHGVPPAVTADAFYEKGAGGFAVLVPILKAMTQEERLLAGPKESSLAPVWIPRVPKVAAVTPHVIVTCPQCLRVFPNSMQDAGEPLIVAECVYCASKIEYELGFKAGVPLEDKFTRKTGAGAQAPMMIPSLRSN